MSKYAAPELTKEEEWIVKEVQRTGNLSLFSSHFFCPPGAGSRWMPNDAIGHYRHAFRYEQLFDAWRRAGTPDTEFDIVGSSDQPWHINVDWTGSTPEFLVRHGFLFPVWIEPVIAQDMDAALVITATGAGKTAGVAISSLIYGFMYPGFEYMNIAPSEKQAQLILAELDKWAGPGTRFRDFIQITSRHKLYTLKPYALCTILSPFGPGYPSHFSCQTIGEKSADQLLGESKDRFSIDECQLVDDLQVIVPKAITRFRGTRPNGKPRWSSVILLTNPADDPSRMANLEQIKKMIVQIQNNPGQYGAELKAIYLENVTTGENLYVTKHQSALHHALMSSADQSRWLEGSTATYAYTSEIPTRLITENVDPVLDKQVTDADNRQKYSVVGRSGLGIIRYELPREEDHIYLVSGDPGKNNAINIDFNNVPVVTTWDITHLLEEPSKLVYFAMLDGQGDYKPWLNSFRYAMIKYRARGYYDATNQPGFESAGAFDNSLDFEYGGNIIKSPASYITQEVSLANNNKRFARTLFTLLAQDGQFAWPQLDTLVHQAAKYKESGPGVKKIPDDILASIFIYCMALRVEGSLWDKVVKRYYMPEMSEEGAARIEEENRVVSMSRGAARGMNTRGNRGRRR